MEFERNIDPKEAMNIGKVANAMELFSLYRYSKDWKKGQNITGGGKAEYILSKMVLDPLRDFVYCYLFVLINSKGEKEEFDQYDIAGMWIKYEGRTYKFPSKDEIRKR